jgi:hypothetical protein
LRDAGRGESGEVGVMNTTKKIKGTKDIYIKPSLNTVGDCVTIDDQLYMIIFVNDKPALVNLSNGYLRQPEKFGEEHSNYRGCKSVRISYTI